jgi:RNA polymerase sigma-70 factor (ECF subfamily)
MGETLSVEETATLLAQCRAGDEVAWEELVRRYQGRVFAVTLRYLRDREEARDVAQDVFVALYRRLDDIRDDRAFLAWLLRLTRNASLDRLRRLQARRWDRAVPVEEAGSLPDPAPGPEDAGREAAGRELIRRALARLSAASREMIVLKEIRELQLTEIAARLRLPLGTVKSRSHRARRELAEAVRGIDPTAAGGADESGGVS